MLAVKILLFYRKERKGFSQRTQRIRFANIAFSLCSLRLKYINHKGRKGFSQRTQRIRFANIAFSLRSLRLKYINHKGNKGFSQRTQSSKSVLWTLCFLCALCVKIYKPQGTQRFFAKDTKNQVCEHCVFFALFAVKIYKPQRTQRFFAKDTKNQVCEHCVFFAVNILHKNKKQTASQSPVFLIFFIKIVYYYCIFYFPKSPLPNPPQRGGRSPL